MQRILHKAVFRLRSHLLQLVNGLVRKPWLRFCGMQIGTGALIRPLQVTWPHQVRIGARCQLEAGTYFKFDGIWSPGPSIVLEDDCFIGVGCEFNIRRGIIIGRGSAIASGCKFIDHDHGMTGTRIDETRGKEAPIQIGCDVWLGANVIVLKGVTVGDSAVIGAGSVITKNVPAGEIWAGVPARKIGNRG